MMPERSRPTRPGLFGPGFVGAQHAVPHLGTTWPSSSSRARSAWRLARGICFFLAALVLIALAYDRTAANEPTRPKILGIALVRFNVTDLNGAEEFYAGALGLSRLHTTAAKSANTATGLPLGCLMSEAECFFINPIQRLEIKLGETRDGTMTDAIGFFVSNAGALHDYLVHRGVQADELILDSPQMTHFAVLDAERHRLFFVQSSGNYQFSVAGPSSPASNRLIHAGIVVHNRAAEDRFYKDILGFHVYWHGGMKEGEDNWVDMQVPDGTDWLEYMLNVPENATHKQLGVMNHIALGVPDIHKAREQLIKNGWKGTEEPKIGRDGKWQLNLYDPDETRVEFMEFTPSKEPCCAPYTGPHPGPQP
jgi:catechol 2,3-dioxygenase-like lactoylglutathione lyase family enzyme